jgi:dolichyl-diphosphooligosaccharide--protein glycosyltransferase
VATLLVLPFVKPNYGFNHYLYSLFQPTILVLGVVAVLLFSVLSSFLREKGYSKWYYPGAIAALVVLGTLFLFLALPQFINPLLSGLNIFQQKTGGAATVGEASPLISYRASSWISLMSNFRALELSSFSRPSSWLWLAWP